MEYPSVPALIGVIVSKRYATLHELQTIYSLDDAVDLYEISAVNAYNENKITEGAKQ